MNSPIRNPNNKRIVAMHAIALVLFLCLSIITMTEYLNGSSFYVYRDVGVTQPEVTLENGLSATDLESSRRLLHLGPFYGASTYLNLSPLDIQKATLLVTNVMVGFFAYYGGFKLLWHHSGDNQRRSLYIFLAAIIFGFFYMFNPRAVAGSLGETGWGLTFSYALIPLIFYYFDRSLNEKKFLNIFLCSFFMALAVAGTQQFMIWLPTFVLLPWLLISIFRRRKLHESLTLSIKNVLIICVLWLCISSYWIIPTIWSIQSGMTPAPGYLLTNQMLESFSSTNSITNVIRMMGVWWPYVELTPVIDSSFWVFLTFVPPIAIVLTLFLIRDNRLRFVCISMVLISVFVMFFNKGTQEPVSFFYPILYEIPIVGWMFRVPSHIGMFLPLYVGMTIAIGIYSLLLSAKGRWLNKYAKIALPAFLIFSVSAVGWPAFTGDLSGTFKDNQSNTATASTDPVTIPSISIHNKIVAVGKNSQSSINDDLQSYGVNKIPIVPSDHDLNMLKSIPKDFPNSIIVDKYSNLLFNVLDSESIIVAPFDSTRNHLPAKVWSVATTNDALHGPFHPYLDELGIANNDTDFNYGLVFTWAEDELSVPLVVDDSGKYHVYVRYLENQKGGGVSVALDDVPHSFVYTKGFANRFVWDDLGEFDVTAGMHEITMKNEGGFNAINILVIIPSQSLPIIQEKAHLYAKSVRTIYELSLLDFERDSLEEEKLVINGIPKGNGTATGTFTSPPTASHVVLEFGVKKKDPNLQSLFGIDEISFAADREPIAHYNFEKDADIDGWAVTANSVTIDSERIDSISGMGSLRVGIINGTAEHWEVVSSERYAVHGGVNAKFTADILESNTRGLHGKIVYYDENNSELKWDLAFTLKGSSSISQTLEKELVIPQDARFLSIQFWTKQNPGSTSHFLVDNLGIRTEDLDANWNNESLIYENLGETTQSFKEGQLLFEVAGGAGIEEYSLIRTQAMPITNGLPFELMVKYRSENIDELQINAIYHDIPEKSLNVADKADTISVDSRSAISTNIVLPSLAEYTIATEVLSCENCTRLTVILDSTATEFVHVKTSDSKWFYSRGSTESGKSHMRIETTGEATIGRVMLFAHSRIGETLTDLFTEEHSPKIIDYHQISTTKYEAKLNAASPFILTFDRKYDGFWSASVNGKEYKSTMVYPSANAFYIDQTGDLNITLEYKRQTWLFQGAMITLSSIAFSAFCSIWPSRQVIRGAIENFRISSVRRAANSQRKVSTAVTLRSTLTSGLGLVRETLVHGCLVIVQSWHLPSTTRIIQRVKKFRISDMASNLKLILMKISDESEIAILSVVVMLLILVAILTIQDSQHTQWLSTIAYVFLVIGATWRFKRSLLQLTTTPPYRRLYSTLHYPGNGNQIQISKLHNILSRFKTGKKLDVLLLGAYGSSNVGDLAILSTMIQDLKEDERINYSVASRDPFLKEHYSIKLIDPFSLNGMWRCLKQDVVVVGGGGIYGHETHLHMKLMMPFLLICRMLGKKLVFYDVGVFKAENKIILKMLWFIMRFADDIILRDDTDIEVIPKHLIHRIRIEPDITFNLKPKEPRDQSIVNFLSSTKNIVGLSLRYVNLKDIQNQYDKQIASVVKEVIEEQFLKTGTHVLFMPFSPDDQSYIDHYFSDLIDSYSDKFIILDTAKFTVDEIKWIVGRLQLTVGMRLHFQIFSHDQNIPFVGISYAPKNTNFLTKVNAPMIDAYKITTEDLCRAILRTRSVSSNLE